MVSENKTSQAANRLVTFLRDARENPTYGVFPDERHFTITNQDMEAIMEKYQRMEEDLHSIASICFKGSSVSVEKVGNLAKDVLQFDPLSES